MQVFLELPAWTCILKTRDKNINPSYRTTLLLLSPSQKTCWVIFQKIKKFHWKVNIKIFRKSWNFLEIFDFFWKILYLLFNDFFCWFSGKSLTFFLGLGDKSKRVVRQDGLIFFLRVFSIQHHTSNSRSTCICGGIGERENFERCSYICCFSLCFLNKSLDSMTCSPEPHHMLMEVTR